MFDALKEKLEKEAEKVEKEINTLNFRPAESLVSSTLSPTSVLDPSQLEPHLKKLSEELQKKQQELIEFAEEKRSAWMKKKSELEQKVISDLERELEELNLKLAKARSDLASAKLEQDIVTGYRKVMLGK